MGIMEHLNSYRFIFFLRWLAEDHHYDADMIINVVESPYKYRTRWFEFCEREEENDIN